MPILARCIPIVGVSLFFGSIGLLSFGRSGPTPVRLDEPPPPIHPPNYGYALRDASFRGAISCAAASCHNGGQFGKVGSEYNTWIEKDPHSRAYGVLFNKQSQHIAERLQSGAASIVPAQEITLCLKCHALNPECTDPHSMASESNQSEFAVQGVSCESCHGGAGNYLSIHYQPSFLMKTRCDKAEEYGLYPTKDLAFRVTMCASCHLGNENQEVNHDLIAAGHPALKFEYSNYQANPKYRAHWTEKNYGPDFDARAWAVGQVSLARAAVDLLRSRAERAEQEKSAAKTKTPWPELSEFSCFACHKSLDTTDGVSWSTLPTDRRPGSLPWGSWITPILPLLAQRGELLGFGGEPSLAELDKLRIMMESSAKAADDAAQSRAALCALDAWLRRLQDATERNSLCRPLTGEQVAQLFHDVAARPGASQGKLDKIDSDAASLYFESLTALTRAQSRRSGHAPPPDRLETLNLLRQLVPRPPQYSSPPDQQPSLILELFQQLRDQPPSKAEPRP